MLQVFSCGLPSQPRRKGRRRSRGLEIPAYYDNHLVGAASRFLDDNDEQVDGDAPFSSAGGLIPTTSFEPVTPNEPRPGCGRLNEWLLDTSTPASTASNRTSSSGQSAHTSGPAFSGRSEEPHAAAAYSAASCTPGGGASGDDRELTVSRLVQQNGALRAELRACRVQCAAAVAAQERLCARNARLQALLEWLAKESRHRTGMQEQLFEEVLELRRSMERVLACPDSESGPADGEVGLDSLSLQDAPASGLQHAPLLLLPPGDGD